MPPAEAGGARGGEAGGAGGAEERQAVKAKADEVTEAVEADPPPTGFFKYQRQAEQLYQNDWVQISVAFLICANFVTNMIEKQIDPDPDPDRPGEEEIFKAFGTFFNIAFLFELILNMYSSWLCRFWKDSWNWFDFLVVTIGILTEVEAPLPGPLSKLRMMRAFRVFRLFKRAPELNKILTSLLNALPGVFNAFIIMILVMSIYAIMAVGLFREKGDECDVTCVEDPLRDCMFPVTARVACIGADLFGTFLKSFYSLFQVLTHESWSEAVTRPMFADLFTGGPNGPTVGVADVATMIFFASFVIINSVVLINVVVAVLLDQMCGEPPVVSSEGGPPGPSPPPPPDDGERDDSLRSAGLASEEPWVAGVRQELDTVQADLQQLHDEFSLLLAEVNSGVEKARADVLAMWRQLDEMIELVRELSRAPIVARRRV